MPVGSWWGWPPGRCSPAPAGSGGVAVVPAHRRVGLGGALTEAIVAYLEDRGVATVLLHATALGRPVYERLGFVPETAYLTLTGPTLPRSARARGCGRGGRSTWRRWSPWTGRPPARTGAGC